MTGLYDHNGALITKRVQSCIAAPDVTEIEHITLDGQPHIQQIGTAAEIAETSVYLTMAQKMTFDFHKRTAAPLKVVFDGRYYIGLIRGKPAYERIPSDRGPYFLTSFTLLVQSQGVV